MQILPMDSNTGNRASYKIVRTFALCFAVSSITNCGMKTGTLILPLFDGNQRQTVRGNIDLDRSDSIRPGRELSLWDLEERTYWLSEISRAFEIDDDDHNSKLTISDLSSLRQFDLSEMLVQAATNRKVMARYASSDQWASYTANALQRIFPSQLQLTLVDASTFEALLIDTIQQGSSYQESAKQVILRIDFQMNILTNLIFRMQEIAAPNVERTIRLYSHVRNGIRADDAILEELCLTETDDLSQSDCNDKIAERRNIIARNVTRSSAHTTTVDGEPEVPSVTYVSDVVSQVENLLPGHDEVAEESTPCDGSNADVSSDGVNSQDFPDSNRDASNQRPTCQLLPNISFNKEMTVPEGTLQYFTLQNHSAMAFPGWEYPDLVSTNGILLNGVSADYVSLIVKAEASPGDDSENVELHPLDQLRYPEQDRPVKVGFGGTCPWSRCNERRNGEGTVINPGGGFAAMRVLVPISQWPNSVYLHAVAPMKDHLLKRDRKVRLVVFYEGLIGRYPNSQGLDENYFYQAGGSHVSPLAQDFTELDETQTACESPLADGHISLNATSCSHISSLPRLGNIIVNVPDSDLEKLEPVYQNPNAPQNVLTKLTIYSNEKSSESWISSLQTFSMPTAGCFGLGINGASCSQDLASYPCGLLSETGRSCPEEAMSLSLVESTSGGQISAASAPLMVGKESSSLGPIPDGQDQSSANIRVFGEFDADLNRYRREFYMVLSVEMYQGCRDLNAATSQTPRLIPGLLTNYGPIYSQQHISNLDIQNLPICEVQHATAHF